MNRTATITPAPIGKTLTVQATPEKAFRVFTEGVDRWWPRSHTIGTAPLKEVVLEQKPAGRWYGVDVEGGEQDWGEVLAWEPPRRLLLAWRISGAWAYDPAVATEVEVLFTDLGDGAVRVDFEHRHLERLGAGAEQAATMLGGGWASILELYKTVAES